MVVSLRRKYRPTITQRDRANSLASDQLDTMADMSATAADIERRKQRLLNGPGEFRDSRSDQRSARPFTRISAERKLSNAAEGMAAYRDREAAVQANLQRLRAERLMREQSGSTKNIGKPNRKKRGSEP